MGFIQNMVLLRYTKNSPNHVLNTSYLKGFVVYRGFHYVFGERLTCSQEPLSNFVLFQPTNVGMHLLVGRNQVTYHISLFKKFGFIWTS